MMRHHGVVITFLMMLTRTRSQSLDPTRIPTSAPSPDPSGLPTPVPSMEPTKKPTRTPTLSPTLGPSVIPTSMPTSNPSRMPTSAPSALPTLDPTPEPSQKPSPAPSPLPTETCGETLDQWDLSEDFETDTVQWSGRETLDSSLGWVCPPQFHRCWSRIRESDADELTAETNARTAIQGDWWGYAEASNTGLRSAAPDDSHPFKEFSLLSPEYPLSIGGARPGFLWPRACVLALAFEYTLFGVDARNLSLLAWGCYDQNETNCLENRFYYTGGKNNQRLRDNCEESPEFFHECRLECGNCNQQNLSQKLLWTVSGNEGPDWIGGSAVVPPGTKRLEFLAVTGASELSDVALDDVRLAPAPSASPTVSFVPTSTPTPKPTFEPTPGPTKDPSPSPTHQPSPVPSSVPSASPSHLPTSPSPTVVPSPSPTALPTGVPTMTPGMGGSGGGSSGSSSSDFFSSFTAIAALIAVVVFLCVVAAWLASRVILRRSSDNDDKDDPVSAQRQNLGGRRGQTDPRGVKGSGAANPKDGYLPVTNTQTSRPPWSVFASSRDHDDSTASSQQRGRRRNEPSLPPPPPPPQSQSGSTAALKKKKQPAAGALNKKKTIDEELGECVDGDAVLLLDDPAYAADEQKDEHTINQTSETVADARLDGSLPFLDSQNGWGQDMLEFAMRAEREEDLAEDDARIENAVRSHHRGPPADDWAAYDAAVQPRGRVHDEGPAVELAVMGGRTNDDDDPDDEPPPAEDPTTKSKEDPSSSSSFSSKDPKDPDGASGEAATTTKENGQPSADQVQTVIGDFSVTHMIGKGAFGRVLLAIKRSGQEGGRAFAIKVLDKEVVRSTGQAQHTRAERETLAALRHPFVVRLRYAFQSRDRLYLVTDFYAGGSLERHLDDAHPNGLGPARTLYYSASLVSALRHCHAAGVVHRDIKPGNVLIDARGDVALTDFGLCALGVLEDGAPLRSFCGTITYMAPELLVGNAYGTSVDWWALGALVFEMGSGRPPFEDPNRRRMFYTILHIPPPYPLHFSGELVELLSGFLEKRSERRLGVIRPLPDGAVPSSLSDEEHDRPATAPSTATTASVLPRSSYQTESQSAFFKHPSPHGGGHERTKPPKEKASPSHHHHPMLMSRRSKDSSPSHQSSTDASDIPPPPPPEPTKEKGRSRSTTPTPQQLQAQLQEKKAVSQSKLAEDSGSTANAKPPKKSGRTSLLGSFLTGRPPAPPPTERLSDDLDDDAVDDEFGRGDDPIKNAAYFAPIDWIALVERRLTPPWIPSLKSNDDVAYVPKRVRDRRSASIHDEFGNDECEAQRAFGGNEARISRQTASFGYNDADMQALAQLRGDRDNSTGIWGDFSYSAPPRGETILVRHPMPVAVTPSGGTQAPRVPPQEEAKDPKTTKKPRSKRRGT